MIKEKKRKNKSWYEERPFKHGQYLLPGQTHTHIHFRDRENLKHTLILKLKDHRMSLSKYLYACCKLFLAEDPRIMDMLNEYKVVNKIQSKNEINKMKREQRKTEKFKRSLNLSQEEVSQIYDLIESGDFTDEMF